MNKDAGPLVAFTWGELLALDQLPSGCLLAYSDANLHQRGNVERHILTLGLSASETDKNGGRARAYVWARVVWRDRRPVSPATKNATDFDTTFLRSVGVLAD